jgi:hypothetical protein
LAPLLAPLLTPLLAPLLASLLAPLLAPLLEPLLHFQVEHLWFDFLSSLPHPPGGVELNYSRFPGIYQISQLGPKVWKARLGSFFAPFANFTDISLFCEVYFTQVSY